MPRQLKERTYNCNTMTEAEYFSRIRSVLRRGFMYWRPMMAALKAAERPNKSANKRLKYEYKCAKCKKWFPRKNVHIDHIVDCGSLNCYEDIAPFIKRMNAEDMSDYQVLCKPCHKIKTQKAKIKKNG